MLYQVKDLARLSGVRPDTIRYYTKIKLLHPRRNPANAYQLYDQKDLKRLEFIRRAKNLGYSLKEITQIFKEAEKGKSPCPLVRDLIQHRIHDHRKWLEELMELQERMEQALAKWATMPDGVPTGDSVCHLIESVENGESSK